MPLHIFSTGFYSGGHYYLFCDSLNHVNDLALNFLPTLLDNRGHFYICTTDNWKGQYCRVCCENWYVLLVVRERHNNTAPLWEPPVTKQLSGYSRTFSFYVLVCELRGMCKAGCGDHCKMSQIKQFTPKRWQNLYRLRSKAKEALQRP